MNSQKISTTIISRIHAGRLSEARDELAVEEPLQIQLLYGPSGKEQQKNLAITMRTPGNDDELAAGFLLTEGIIENKQQLLKIIPGASGENSVLAILNGNFYPTLDNTERNFYISSSCGVCGKSSIDAIKKVASFPQSNESVQISPAVLHRLPHVLHDAQFTFQHTGGLHASALFDTRGNLLLIREDVGRHNALDKLIGHCLLQNQIPLSNVVLLLSGRTSFELVQKAAIAGITMIASIGAPSSLAVQLAAEAGITLIGFLRHDRFNIYSCAERIVETAEQI